MMAGWLRHCATSQRVASLMPNGAIGIFFDLILPAAQFPWV